MIRLLPLLLPAGPSGSRGVTSSSRSLFTCVPGRGARSEAPTVTAASGSHPWRFLAGHGREKGVHGTLLPRSAVAPGHVLGQPAEWMRVCAASGGRRFSARLVEGVEGLDECQTLGRARWSSRLGCRPANPAAMIRSAIRIAVEGLTCSKSASATKPRHPCPAGARHRMHRGDK
jgi:hypothetical protein